MVFRVRKLNSKVGELAWTVYYYLVLQLGQEAGKTVNGVREAFMASWWGSLLGYTPTRYRCGWMTW